MTDDTRKITEALDATVSALESLLSTMSGNTLFPHHWLKEDAEKINRAREAVNTLKST